MWGDVMRGNNFDDHVYQGWCNHGNRYEGDQKGEGVVLLLFLCHICQKVSLTVPRSWAAGLFLEAGLQVIFRRAEQSKF